MTYRSTSDAYDTWTVAVPAGTQDNDIVILCVRAQNSTHSITFTWPAGFTQWYLRNSGSYYFAVAWKRASSESGTYTVAPVPLTYEGSFYTVTPAIICSSFRGRKLSGDPLNVGSNSAYTTNNTTVRAAGVTTSVDKTDLVWLGHSASYPYLLSTPAGFTAVLGNNWPYYDYPMNSFYVNRSTPAGATGNVDALSSGVTDVKHAFLLALLEEPTTSVSDSLGIVFNTQSTVADTLALEWHTLNAVVPQTMQVVFHTSVSASTSLSVVWDTLSDTTSVSKAVGLVWDTASDLTPVTAAATTLIWHTLSTTSSVLAVMWRTRIEMELSQLNSSRVFSSVGAPTSYNSIGDQRYYYAT